jgi:hypothetical protein
MTRTPARPVLPLALAAALAAAAGCKSQAGTRPFVEPPPPDVRTTDLTYADTDAFDALLEAALVNQDPVIAVHTDTPRPDWDGRLNAWIAAWARGGKVEPPPRTARGQVPVPAVDGDTLREFRLLVGDLMDRVEDLARVGAGWWAEERVRSRRVALLKPYNLRFHRGGDGTIQLVFFNGNYAGAYPEHVRALTGTSGDGEPEAWTRTVQCSACNRHKAGAGEVGRLTGRGEDR